MKNFHNKFVITGGPGFGKTSLLLELEKLGFCVFHEAARIVIEQQQQLEDPILPWIEGRRIEFDNILISILQNDYVRHNSRKYGFYDRGFPDLIGWREFDNLSIDGLVDLVNEYRYEPLVFFTKPWRDIYITNETRPYSFEDATRINKILENCYSRYGYRTHLGSFLRKV
jgi:predicted ATPase